MEKVYFTTTQMKKLEEIFKKNMAVVIEGKNGKGEDFVTTGRIYGDSRGLPVITKDMFYVSFGRHGEYDDKIKMYAPFHLNVERRTCLDDQLIVKSIKDENGKMVFKNKDFSNQRGVFEKNFKNIKSSNNEIVAYDPVTSALKNMIAKPVMVNGQIGVFAGIVGATKLGYPEIIILTGSTSKIVMINENSILFTENINGEVKCLARNTNENCREIFIKNSIELEHD